MASSTSPSDPQNASRPFARRDLLYRGAAALVGLGGLASSSSAESMESQNAPLVDPDEVFETPAAPFKVSCPLTPSDVQGPFWLNLALLRQDITEGLVGLPLRFLIQVVSQGTCAPLPNAVVDLWHDDPDGAYSGFNSEGTAGQTWLRGIQVANSAGVVRFDTIYPGWYTGRTAHVHVKINPNAGSELTTQLYFDDEITDRVYQFNAPYDLRGPNPTSNASDNFYDPRLEVGLVQRSGMPGLVARMRIVVA